MEEYVKKKLEEEVIACVDKALQTGYERGYNDGKKFNEENFDYQSGLEKGKEEAWEVAKKIVLSKNNGGLSYEEFTTCFGCVSVNKVLTTYSPSEVIDKIKECEEKQENERCCRCIHGCETGRLKHNDYCAKCVDGNNFEEKQDEIKVGDEITGHGNDARGIVIGFDGERRAKILWANGNINYWTFAGVKQEKTGRTFPQIAEVLEQLKGGNNGET